MLQNVESQVVHNDMFKITTGLGIQMTQNNWEPYRKIENSVVPKIQFSLKPLKNIGFQYNLFLQMNWRRIKVETLTGVYVQDHRTAIYGLETNWYFRKNKWYFCPSIQIYQASVKLHNYSPNPVINKQIEDWRKLRQVGANGGLIAGRNLTKHFDFYIFNRYELVQDSKLLYLPNFMGFCIEFHQNIMNNKSK